MLKSLVWTVAAIAAGNTLFASSASADDAYVCDGGRLVYARPETLEKLKQTDPCVQAYYATTPPSPGASLAPTVASTLPSGTSIAPPSATANNPAANPKSKQPAVKLAPLKGTRDAEVRTPRTKPALDKAAQAKAPESAPGTDFRNVRVINAPSSAQAVFHHDR